MKSKKNILYLSICMLTFLLYATSREKYIVGVYAFMSKSSFPFWDKGFRINAPLKIVYENPDTVFFYHTNDDGSKDIRKYIKRVTDGFNNEPQNINGHQLLGAFRENKGLPGFTVLLYVNKDKGMLSKIFYSPGRLLLADYVSVDNKNHFKDIVFKHAARDSVRLKLKLKQPSEATIH